MQFRESNKKVSNNIPNNTYTIQDISEWAQKKTVSLPTVQRGFVWKPYQIENLWDSLLRGYPIGAFVLSPRQTATQEESKYEMLDGQQRATAICLGFGKETFRESQDKIKVFIDLEKPKNEDNRKYIFRVITKSHPWGYRRIDNTKTLDSDNIRKAMNFYNVQDHLEEALEKFFPFDAIFPVPFNLFTNAVINNKTLQELIAAIREWPHYRQIFQRNTKEKQNESLECITEGEIDRRIDEIFMMVKIMLDENDGQKVPVLYFNFEMFKRSLDYSKSQETDDRSAQINIDENRALEEVPESSDNQQTDEDEIENLFIRLNAGGTPLRGEELNYSVLKAYIGQELQNKIEQSCEGIFKPSRFITIAYRLFQNQRKEDAGDAITMRIKPKQFQKTMSKHLKDFEVFLNNVLDKRGYGNNNTLLEYTIRLLEYNEADNLYGLPYLITCKLADNAPEIIFMLFYRLLIKKDRFDFETETILHRKMLGMITLFVWLGKGEKQRDHAKLLSNIWPCAKTLRRDLFWSSSTVQRAMLDNILTPFPAYDKKYDKKHNKYSLIRILEYDAQSNSDIGSKFHKETGFGSFIDKMFFNHELILYVQREFLAKHFKKEQSSLDDTNLPFDWDHISPNKYIYKKFGIPRLIKDWYNSNGNYRAWPYSLNRIDQDNVPSIKLNPMKRENYSAEEDEVYEAICKKWRQHLNEPNLTDVELKALLKEWSFCDDDGWVTCKVTDMKKEFKPVYNLIMKRNLSICEEWYEQLKIEELLPNNQVRFHAVVDGRKWDLNPKSNKELREIICIEDRDNWVSKPIAINGTSIYIYFSYSQNKEELLQEDNVDFGIYENNSGFISKLKINDKTKRDYDTDREKWVQGYFTLVSFDEDSYVELFKNFKRWLEIFPDKEVKSLADTFTGSLAQYYQNRIGEVVPAQ